MSSKISVTDLNAFILVRSIHYNKNHTTDRNRFELSDFKGFEYFIRLT